MLTRKGINYQISLVNDLVKLSKNVILMKMCLLACIVDVRKYVYI